MVAAQLTTMDVDCIRVYGDRDYKPKNGDLILGWGSGHYPGWWELRKEVDCQYINTPKSICNSVDKITALNLFKKHGVPIPDFTTDHTKALSWCEDGSWICCRQSVEGYDGAGLVLAKKKSEMVSARLYTQFIPNKQEYRIYCFAGNVVDVLKKVPDDDAKDPHIRTESNGYIYARYNNLPKEAKDAAKEATDALDLTFAGVDLIIGNDGNPYVLETNTAPGIGQITAQRIATAIKEYAGL